MIKRTDVVVIGAGHAGLAMSNRLTGRGVEHVVLERDDIASSWQNQRWDSFTLLTPNWATWLPDWHYTGDDPHGFMGRDEMVAYLRDYAASFAAPVHPGVDVRSLHIEDDGRYRLTTYDGELTARGVVISTGPYQRPRVPAWSEHLPDDITHLHSSAYRSPAALPDGAVLIVGSGPSGQQIAEDLLRAGRRVYLSVGRHRRVPRRYRGRDYYWWLELGGFYEKTAEDVPPANRRSPVAPALTGFDGGHDLDLRKLCAHGAVLLGRSTGLQGTRVQLDANLTKDLADGDQAYGDFTDWVDRRLFRFEGLYGEPEPFERFPDPPETPAEIELRRAGISTIVWATGFTSQFRDWVHAPVFDDQDRLVHTRGTTAAPGLYVLGQGWLHRLRSPFIRGAEEDANHLATVWTAAMP